MPTFCETQFPPGLSRGAKGGPRFSTTVIESASGAEQRIAQWATARAHYDVSHSERTPAQSALLRDFFYARAGRLYGFRFKDWGDYSTDQPTPGTLFATAQLTTKTFQLQRLYTSGGVTYTRKISKPVSGTVALYNATTPVPAAGTWTLDTTTGIATFGSAPGYVPNWSGEYDIPVRFDTDAFDVELQDVGIHAWEGITLVELLL